MSENWESAHSIYDFTVKDIKGNDVHLENYKGHVCLIVNVASRCGLTNSNYDELNELNARYGNEKGLKILAFPCNQFANEEPGTSEDIVCFMQKKNSNFEMFDKIKVNGENADPLWKFLKKNQKGVFGNAIKWNFTKFIIDKNGIPVERHGPTTSPLSLAPNLEKYF